MMIPTIDTDVLVIGGGGAGARAALSAAETGARVVLAVKGMLGTSGATAYRVSSVGGFQAAMGEADPDDSPDEHFNDIMRAAQGMCRERLARIVAAEAPVMLRDLITRGVELITENGRPVVSTGCFASRSRMHWIVGHGHSIMNVLTPAMAAHGVEVRERVVATSLLLTDGACVGATLLDRQGELVAVRAGATILCTGGAARLFLPSLVPPDVTGDGYALAFRAGAALANLEFIQFGFGVLHPITHLLSAQLWSLIPQMRNANGEDFLGRYLPSGLRPEVSANARAAHFPFSSRYPERFVDIAADTELRAGRGASHGGILLDFGGVADRLADVSPAAALRWRYFRQTLREHGIDPENSPVEVGVFGHAFNGGILIDDWGQSTLEGLYAAGEAAAGPHGADRLGGNMLMTSQVFGQRAGRAAAHHARSNRKRTFKASSLNEEAQRLSGMQRSQGRWSVDELVRHLRQAMSGVRIVRDERSLQSALDAVAEGESALRTARVIGQDDLRHALEFENLLLVARLLTSAAVARRESRGSHYRADFPEPDDPAWRYSILFRCVDGQIEQETAVL